MEQKGYVDYVGSKDFGNRRAYSFRIRDVEKWFRTGSVDPKLQKNDLITFQYTDVKGNGEVNVGSIQKLDLSAPDSGAYAGSDGGGYSKPAPRASGFSKSSDAAEKDLYWRNKEARDLKNEGHRLGNEKRIQWQAARNSAIAVVDILTREKALVIPEKKGAGSDVILGKIEDLTQAFYESTTNLGVETEVVSIDGERDIYSGDNKEVF